MAKDLKDLTVAVIDEGVFVHLAQRLVGQVGRVLYWRESREFLPTIKKAIIGDGFDGIERINDFWSVKKDVDLFVFPSLHLAAEQIELESQGFPVWGARRGDCLETNREKFQNTLSEVGLKVPPYVIANGLTELRSMLKDMEDKYIKISKLRGEFETTHWRSWREDERVLDFWSFKFGPAKELIRFFVFDAIETNIEAGFDTYCVDGKFPHLILNDMECKDKGCLVSVMERGTLPDPHNQILDAFGPVLGSYGYRGFFGTEFRVKDDQFWFTDATCRLPFPPGGSELMLCGNLAEILWGGANGELVEFQPTANFAAECMLSYKGLKGAWDVVDFNPKLMPHVKCANCCMIEGRICFPPDLEDDDDLGWMVATGDTIPETIERMKELEAMLPDDVHCNTRCLYDILKEAEEAEKVGVELTDGPTPKPETALD